MNFQQIPVSNAIYQEFDIDYGKERLRFTLRFNSVGSFWVLDLFDLRRNRTICRGLSLAVGVPLLWRTSLPFFLWLEDESGLNLDPITEDDMGSRCFLYIGEKE